MHWETDAQTSEGMCFVYHKSELFQRSSDILCCVVAVHSYLVSLLIASTAKEIKEKLIYMLTPQFVLSKPQHAALIH